MEKINILSEDFTNLITDVKIVRLESEKDQESSSSEDEWEPPSDRKSCSICRVEFSQHHEQLKHCKMDWHIYNLKLSLDAKKPITEENYNKMKENDLNDSKHLDASSTSSDNEETLDTYATSQGKIFLRNKEGKVLSLHKCLIFNKKEEMSEELLQYRLNNFITNQQWTLLLLGGGCFAGAVFRGLTPILHKTLRFYVVRAGQGGLQSSRDSKGGSQPKSAGASLRRQNEQNFVQQIQEILEAWKSEIENSSLIMYRAAGPYNKSILFGGKHPVLVKNDKMRTVPFSTRRATFKEVRRVHEVLTQATVYKSLETATTMFSQLFGSEYESRRKKNRSKLIKRDKSRTLIERPLPTERSPSAASAKSDEDADDAELELSLNNLDISFDHLKEFDDTLPNSARTQRKKKEKKKTKSKGEENEDRKLTMDAVVSGDVDRLQSVLNMYMLKGDIQKSFVNKVLDLESNTLLHIAVLHKKINMIKFLVDNGADLCARNKKHKTPYCYTDDKEIREYFREFARANPTLYNYNKAEIPVNALTAEEAAEKKRTRRKIKKKKEQERTEEEKDKKRFLGLSDREKRALAAEQRIINAGGTVMKRCFLCGLDIAGKVPFEYSNYLFCSMDCLKSHRLRNPVRL